MQFITLSKDNIHDEHICCALSSKSTIEGVEAKKKWLTDRMDEGLVFQKSDTRGKVFIEFIPAEKAWVPISAPGYLVINCFWVSGSYKGQGYGTALLSQCEEYALQNRYKGVVVIVGNKKKAFLTDKDFMIRNGYRIVDSCAPYFELVVKKFDQSESPSFCGSAHKGMGDGISGIDIFYTAQCPLTIPYTKLLRSVILESEYPVRLHQITSREMAQEHVCPITTYSVFVNGQFYTQEILTPAKLQKLIEANCI